jgi:hypothetical protein
MAFDTKQNAGLPMKFVFFLFALLPVVGTSQLLAEMPSMPDAQNLLIHNRILAKVNGKTISLMDVVKKMDVYLDRAYPELAQSKTARYQFYSTQWKNTLNQLIDTELMMADAEAIEIKINDSDVRESMQERFGPNIMANLEKIGLSYDEAREMIYSELVVQRMTWYRVQSKAIMAIHPEDVKGAYKDYCEKNPPSEEWIYQVLSIRAADPTAGSLLGKKAYELLAAKKVGLEGLPETLKGEMPLDPETFITAQEYTLDGKKISESHKEVLLSLLPGAYSEPIAQKSRDQSTVFRIFFLKDYIKKDPPIFGQIFEKLQDQLIDQAIEKESEVYIVRLRERFGFDEKLLQENLPQDFQPFTLN